MSRRIEGDSSAISEYLDKRRERQMLASRPQFIGKSIGSLGFPSVGPPSAPPESPPPAAYAPPPSQPVPYAPPSPPPAAYTPPSTPPASSFPPSGPAGFASPAAAATPEPDSYLDRLVKLIPAEAVALYVTLSAILRSASQVPGWLPWLVFVVLLALTPAYTWKATQSTSRPTPYAQIGASTVAFFIWVFALGGPFANLPWYLPVYGGVLLPLYTAVVAGFLPPE